MKEESKSTTVTDSGWEKPVKKSRWDKKEVDQTPTVQQTPTRFSETPTRKILDGGASVAKTPVGYFG